MFVLAEIQPLDSGTGLRTTVRVASSHDTRQTGWNGLRWLPAIAVLGALEVELFDGDFTSAVAASQTSIGIAIQPLSDIVPDTLALRWQDAPFSMWASDAPDAPVLRVVGTVRRFERAGGLLKLTVEPGADAGGTDVLSLTYAGTTGIEGPADLKGQVKPWLLGTCGSVEPVLIDAVNNVYQFSAYGPIKSVLALYEKGASFGTGMGDFADYTALVAATIPGGRWATCLASGLVRLGAPQYGVITGDVEGDFTGGVFVERTGAFLQRIATVRGIDAGTIDSASLTALDAFAATLPAGGKIEMYLREPTTFIDLARRLCLPLNAQAGYSLLGKLFASRVVIDTADFTLDALGRELPVVSEMVEADTLPPYKRIIFGAERSWRVHGLDEVAFQAQPLDRGRYDAATAYREGDIVDLSDGSRWIYTSPTASTGNAPETGSAFWSSLSGGVNLEGITTNALTIAEEALRNALFREETDAIIVDDATGLTIRELHDQLSLTVGGNSTYINFIRSIDSGGNGKVVLGINGDGAITGIFNTLTQGFGALKFVADEFSFVDPDGGNQITPLSYGVDNILYLDTVRIKKLAVDAVETTNIQINNVTDSREWEADFAGADGDTLGAASLSTWAAFGNSGAKAICTFASLPSGALMTITMDFNAQRTGGDNDRVEFRLKRVAPGGAVTYHPTVFRAGMANYPANLHWQWRDSIATTGPYEYHIEYRRVTDKGSYFACAMLASVGKR